jgi:hypothetical protein
MKEDGTEEARSTHEREKKYLQHFRLENVRKRGHTEDICVDGRLILKLIFKE